MDVCRFDHMVMLQYVAGNSEATAFGFCRQVVHFMCQGMNRAKGLAKAASWIKD